MDIKFWRSIGQKKEIDKIRTKIFRVAGIQNLLTCYDVNKLLLWFGHVIFFLWPYLLHCKFLDYVVPAGWTVCEK